MCVHAVCRASLAQALTQPCCSSQGPEGETEVLIQSRLGINRAFDGDIVAVELLPREQWAAPSAALLESTTAAAQAEEDVPGRDQSAAEALEEAKKPTGKIVGIIRRNWRQYCGHLRPKGEVHAHRRQLCVCVDVVLCLTAAG